LTAVVTLRKNAQKMTYSFGKETDDHMSVYARHSDREFVFLVPVSVVKPLSADLADRTVFNFDPDRAKELKLTGWRKLGKGVQTLRLVKAAKGWEVKEAPEKDFVLDINQVIYVVDARLAKLSAEKLLKGGPKGAYELDDMRAGVQIDITLEGEKT